VASDLRRLLFLGSRRPAVNALWGYRHAVVDLGDRGGDRLRGIYSRCYDDATVGRYIQAQFLENAETYARDYDALSYFRGLIDSTLARVGLDPTQRRGLSILDVGSGSGNSIFPLVELCPGCRLLGSDLSVDMLVLLKLALASRGWEDRCHLLQLNAEELDFRPGAFDLVVGAFILHHLLEPERTIAGCAQILKPGGCAIFFEPFEEGFVQLRDCYNDVLADPRSGSLPEPVREFFRAVALDLTVRLGTDKSAPLHQQLDDKWLFPRSYVLELARRHRFSDCTVYSLVDHDNKLEARTEDMLVRTTHVPRDATPGWVWDIVRRHDDAVPADRKADLLLEGCLILKR
jgi:ubiquinone/menaquinone biosynthesis C-methylase UbiE